MISQKLTYSLSTKVNITRNFGKHNKKYLNKNGEKYENIIYYPRNLANDMDPDVRATKLFHVQRIKPVKGNPYWEKRLLKDIGLDGKQNDFTILKNIPENNARLWKIKHLIKVNPIIFPYGAPTAYDIENTFIKDNGECIVKKNKDAFELRLKASNEFKVEPRRLQTELLKKNTRFKWLNQF